MYQQRPHLHVSLVNHTSIWNHVSLEKEHCISCNRVELLTDCDYKGGKNDEIAAERFLSSWSYAFHKAGSHPCPCQKPVVT